MKKNGKIQIGWKGNYTVEISLLMGILLPILFSILWIFSFLYDRSVLQGAASEEVFLQNMKIETKAEEDRNMQTYSLGKAKLSLTVLKQKQQVIAKGNGIALIPGIASAFFQDKKLEWKVQEENSYAFGTQRIRAIFWQKALLEERSSG